MRKRVLYIEDDLDLLEIVGKLLDQLVDFTGVASEAEAKQRLKEAEFDLIILDLMLSDLLCLNFLKELHQTSIPIIVYSAYELPLDYEKYVYKSFVKCKTPQEVLLETISSVLKVKKLEARI